MKLHFEIELQKKKEKRKKIRHIVGKTPFYREAVIL